MLNHGKGRKEAAVAEQQLHQPVERYAAQLAALTSLTRSVSQLEASSLHETTEVAARTLGVARASVWTFTPGRDAIECLDLFDQESGNHAAGAHLPRAMCPIYFEALEQTDVIPAGDATRDPYTRELTDGYLRPLGVGALLDAPIHADGEVVGVLCLEHRPGPRTWTPDEQSFAVALANLVSLRLAQRARRESERRSQLILDAVRDGIHGVDAAGRTVFENPAALAMFGWDAGELIGQPAHRMVHHHRPDGSEYPVEECPVWQTLQDGRARYAENEVFFRKDGTSFPVEFSCAPMRNDSGAIAGAVVSFRDVTERRRLEDLRASESRVLRMISEQRTLPEILEEIAGSVDALLPAVRSSVLLVDGTGTCLRRGAAPNLPDVVVEAFDGLAIGPLAASCGTAAHTRCRVVTEDIALDPKWAAWRDIALGAGLRACWSQPVSNRDGHVVATFGLYASAPRVPEAGEMALVERAADLVAIAVDRVRQDEALRASESRFESVARASTDVIGDWDLRTGTMWWSDGFESVFGYPVASLEPDIESWARRVHPDDVARVRTSLDEAITRRDPYWQGEYRFVHHDGRVLHVEDRGCLVTDGNGTPVRFVRGIADITDRFVAQAALRERLKELRCLYRVVDLTTRGARSIDEICRDIARLLPESVLQAEHAVARVVIDGREFRSDGWEEPDATVSRPIVPGGRPIGVVEVGYRRGFHVTGAEVFLPEEHDLIDAVATHIRRMLRDRELADSLARSERLRGVGELTGGVAHDFNNLLQVILGNAELLSAGLGADDGLRELADMTRVAAERGAELTSRLLAFARQQPLDPQPTDVDALLAAMLPLLRRSLGEQLEVVLRFESGGTHALVDPAQLESAVLNLCINARDAMAGGGTLTLGTALTNALACGGEDDGSREATRQVVVLVADTGTGMTPEILARAFDPFFTTKDVGRGSGLGLSMVYGFARQSGGHVTLDSAPGAGTTARLYLPATRASVAASGPPVDAADARGGRETILLVEDDDLVRIHVQGQLEGLGYSVVTAGNGPEALGVLDEREDIDLVFTDIVMPGGMSGRDLAEAVRASLPTLPVLFTSGYSDDAVIRDGRLDAGVTLLAKPYKRVELARKIRQALVTRA